MKAFRFFALAVVAGLVTAPALIAQEPARGPQAPATVRPSSVERARRSGGVPTPQDAQTSTAARTAAAQSVSSSDAPGWRVRHQPAVRIGQPYILGAGEEVPGAVVIWGDITIDGHVTEDLVNVLGNVTLGPTAVIDGSVVSVGGNVTATATSRIDQDLVVVGGGITAPSEFSPRGDHVVVGSPALGDSMRSIVPWFTHGLLWGRVITPGVGWVWGFVFVFLLVYLAIASAFPKGVAVTADTLSKRPISAFFTGMLTLLLVGPVCALLAVSVIGIVVIPFVLCSLVAAWMLGKTAVMRWMGAGVIHEDAPDSRAQAVRSLLIGFVIVTVAYAIPVLGLAAWALVGMTGLGSATLTALATLRRERPAKPPKLAPPVAPVSSGTVHSPEPVIAPSATYGVSTERVLHASMPALTAPFTTSADGEAPQASAPAGFGDAPAAASAFAIPTPDATATDLRSMPRATLLDRLFAAALDALLVAIAINLLPGGVLWFGSRPEVNQFVLVLLAYHAAFWSWKSTTVGSIICNLRLVRIDGAPLRPVDAIVRALSSVLSGAAFGLGFFTIGIDSNRERQAWHDKIAGTLVVRVPKDWPLP